ncbi:ferric-chelate reductase [Grosmannia clavigera kw1407]|uniref:Ferric-chelate reductase n=1 Tax=Grosmannia clavigera (strain kw1407 / UAMH 11150) TaxID=655863 RepID=F0X6M7_GROCL|nr:ferric-chelate reductase [Grosmannia clavigera kw1407]EFX06529.1 ferric-chelate reductase [Grosmannia clavigera kw1407]
MAILGSASAGFVREPRHIQDYGQANTTTVNYWGYASRVLPCTNDAGSCAYLDVVYNAHVAGMLYSGILWATILGVLFVWAVLHYSLGASSSVPSLPTSDAISAAADEPLVGQSRPRTGGLQKLQCALSAWSTQLLQREAPLSRIFGHATRLQVMVLAALVGYLAVWSFVGIVYDTWVTPVKQLAGVYNTRTSLGPWADRLGVLAFALTPLSILLSSRESVLSLLTGVPYQSFNFLHRWLGYLMCVQVALHTIGWTVIEARLYQPQPRVGADWIVQPYMVWGLVAVVLLALLALLSTPWAVRRTGYELFRKAHYVLAVVYIGACWGHWARLRCFLLPSLLFWAADRLARLFRTALLHYRPLPEGDGFGFRSVPARLRLFPDDPEAGDVVRLDLEHNQDEWHLGQHFYLCFADISIWQSHPFTPLNKPTVRGGRVVHSYLIRAKAGETRKLAALTAQKLALHPTTDATTPVIITGPYGEDNSRHILSPAAEKNNVLCIGGGTGIAYVLPVLLAIAERSMAMGSSCSDRIVELVWVMRYADNVEWARHELDLLQRATQSESCSLRLRIRLIHTRCRSAVEDASGSSDDEKAKERDKNACCSCPADSPPSLDVQVGGDANSSDAAARHPDIAAIVSDFVDSTTSGPTVVFASGPGGMISDLRTAVASCASGSKVWKGDARYDIRLVRDDRLE